MPRVPSEIVFLCEACQKRAKPSQVPHRFGRCRGCDGRSWTLVVNYTDTETNLSLPGLLAALVLGFGWFNLSIRRFTAQTIAPGVPADVAQFLTETRSLLVPRVVEYVRLREQQKLQEQGARACQVCGATYFPTADKPWTQQGYCSKSCAAKDGPLAPPVFEETVSRPKRAAILTVACPEGHTFEVPASFAGCIRPCVICGAKTAVPLLFPPQPTNDPR